MCDITQKNEIYFVKLKQVLMFGILFNPCPSINV